MRVAVLWYALTGYLNACLKALAATQSTEIFVVHKSPHPQAPFDSDQFGWIPNQHYWQSNLDLSDLESRIAAFRPDVIVSVGWTVREYRSLNRSYAGKCLRIMTMDNNWHSTPRQWLGVITAPFLIRPIADAVWVPGERQSIFAAKLGFRRRDILQGLYSCDHEAFAQTYESRRRIGGSLPRKFLFVGRFVEEKGIPVLIEAYRKYRQLSANPWPLICCGTGPLQPLLANEVGIQVQGFVQPSSLPAVFCEAGCLLLPSSFEPWGVVVHEAASAGLIILASSSVGATPHLVQNNYNGYVFEPDNSDDLAALMARLDKMEVKKLGKMASASFNLSQQFTPDRWAESLVNFVENRPSFNKH